MENFFNYPEEWRRSVLVLIFKEQNCSNYTGIKLNHTMKMCEKNVRLHSEKAQYRCVVCFQTVDGP